VECEGKITEDHWSKTKSSSNNNFISKSGGRIEMKPEMYKKGKQIN